MREIKNQVVQSRIGAARAVNRALISLYWALGNLIVERQETLGWGKAIVERLSADLKAEFPNMKGFSPQNLWLIRQFYMEYQDSPNLQQLVGEIPWGHNEYFLDMLFYHRFLKCLVAVELKTGRFRPIVRSELDGYDAVGAQVFIVGMGFNQSWV